jgi:nitrogen fixation/metabolism regulation signal transduction histidine kinase
MLWWFHQSLLDRLGLAEVAGDPAVQELMHEYSRQALIGTGVVVLGGTLFVVLTGMYLQHRISGPVYRIKRHMRAIVDGGPVEQISFRDDDQQRELAEVFNQLIQRLGAPKEGDVA